jgi:hypothetical protein
MNDTPRTDEQINGKPCTRFEILAGDSLRNAAVPSEFARQLERELNATNSKIELLMSANADVARIADERDAAEKRVRLLISERDTARGYADQKWKLRQEFHDLFGTDDISEAVALVRELKDRIKRLEDAGNETDGRLGCGCGCDGPCSDCRSASEKWHKAKEVKP